MKKEDYIAMRAARELKNALLVNIGIGIPCQIPHYLGEDGPVLQSETGFIGYRPSDKTRVADNAWSVDKEFIDASGNLILFAKGGSHTHISDTFSLMRSGRIDVSVLGAYQVDETGLVASIGRSSAHMRGYGGAMDLFVGAKRILIAMTHLDKNGNPKIRGKLTMSQTSSRPADLIVTDMAVLKRSEGGLVLLEIAPGYNLRDVIECTEARIQVAEHLTQGAAP